MKVDVDRRTTVVLVVVVILAVGYQVATFTPKQASSAIAHAPKPKDAYGNCRGYKGEVRNLASLVQSRLRNPPSFEHVETRSGAPKGGVFEAVMTYRATNGFGGVDTAVAIGEVRTSDCAARVISID